MSSDLHLGCFEWSINLSSSLHQWVTSSPGGTASLEFLATFRDRVSLKSRPCRALSSRVVQLIFLSLRFDQDLSFTGTCTHFHSIDDLLICYFLVKVRLYTSSFAPELQNVPSITSMKRTRMSAKRRKKMQLIWVSPKAASVSFF